MVNVLKSFRALFVAAFCIFGMGAAAAANANSWTMADYYDYSDQLISINDSIGYTSDDLFAAEVTLDGLYQSYNMMSAGCNYHPNPSDCADFVWDQYEFEYNYWTSEISNLRAALDQLYADRITVELILIQIKAALGIS